MNLESTPEELRTAAKVLRRQLHAIVYVYTEMGLISRMLSWYKYHRMRHALLFLIAGLEIEADRIEKV
jgi:hypothetical protein